MYGPEPTSDAVTLALGLLVSIVIVIAVLWVARRSNAQSRPSVSSQPADQHEHDDQVEMQRVTSVQKSQEADTIVDQKSR